MDDDRAARKQSRRGMLAGLVGLAVGVVAIPQAADAAAGSAAAGPSRSSALGWDVTDAAFGAVADGVADDTSSIRSALKAAGIAGGGTVTLPAGTYRVSSKLIVPPGVTVSGASKYGSTVATSSPSSGVFVLQNASGITNLQITSSVAQTSGVTIDIRGSSAFVDNCQITQYFVAISVGTPEAGRVVGSRISDVNLYGPSIRSGAGAIQFLHYSSFQVTGCVVAGPDAGTQPSFGIRIRNGDTGTISDTNITKHGRALQIDTPAGEKSFAIHASNSLFDSAGRTADGVTVSSAEISPAGEVYDTKFSNCWFGLSTDQSGCTVAPTSAGLVDGLTFTGCEFVGNADSGLRCVGTGVRNWLVTGGYSSGNRSAGIHSADACGSFTISGHRAGPSGNFGPNRWGMVIDSGADQYVVVGNNLIGNTAGSLFDGGSGPATVIANNLV
ncbi:glycosyl hydrolase family 28-related protein [Subtercola endophyticus]|uniref:glycosyl hydrolase family 28-related protein n=1 Tax=Subtercola endophyticus TaxID=2895559 RepID=UPI001E29B484|nr:glycosyl hydrolase family 28-related protein [Subtercola endophyticus]UFS60789.1 glycoside hydrolase family 55 protein [Subtercola endophyticus]